MTSKTPPMPGKNFPESLTPQSRLIKDSERSPNCPKPPKKAPIKNICQMGRPNVGGKNERKTNAADADTKTAPRVPSTDLLGLTLGNSGCLPKLLPINKAPISAL